MLAIVLDIETGKTAGGQEIVREVALVDGDGEWAEYPLDDPQVLKSLLERIAGRTVAGYGVGGDLAILERWGRRHGIRLRVPRSLCLLAEARKRWPRVRSHQLFPMCKAIGINVSARVAHVALDDARVAWELYRRLGPGVSGHVKSRGWLKPR